MDVLLIGYGAIAQEILKHIQPEEDARIVAIIVRPSRVEEVRDAVSARGIEVVSSFRDLTVRPDLVAECAGHSGVRDYGAEALRRGMDFLVISIGVLADAGLYANLVAAAEMGGREARAGRRGCSGGGCIGSSPGWWPAQGNLHFS